MSSSRSKAEAAQSMHSLALAPVPGRARDLLQRTSFPIHPFDQMHGVDTSGLVPAKHLLTGHANDEHVTAYYGVAPSILRALIGHWRETVPPHPIDGLHLHRRGRGQGTRPARCQRVQLPQSRRHRAEPRAGSHRAAECGALDSRPPRRPDRRAHRSHRGRRAGRARVRSARRHPRCSSSSTPSRRRC